MKQITILSCHLGLQGSYANILDLNNYLQLNGYEVLFYATDLNDLYNVTRGSKRVHTFNNLNKLKDYKPDLESIVITDFKTLIQIFKLNIKVICKKFIIMDNNELSYHLNNIKTAKFYNNNLNISRLIKFHQYKEILFLFPPSNESKFKELYPDIPYKIFFKKINWNLLKQVPTKAINKLYYRFDDIDISKIMEHKYGENLITFNEYNEIDLWDFKGMIYYRRKHLEYYEQLGRLVFEFIMLGKEVFFLNNPFEIKDGLTDYLNHYNIEFDNRFKVTTKASELIELMKQDYTFKPWSL